MSELDKLIKQHQQALANGGEDESDEVLYTSLRELFNQQAERIKQLEKSVDWLEKQTEIKDKRIQKYKAIIEHLEFRDLIDAKARGMIERLNQKDDE